MSVNPGRTALQVVLTQELAGTERHVAELARALRARGWRCLIATRRDASESVQRLYAESAELRMLPACPAAAIIPALARLAREEHVDVINAHLGNATYSALGASMISGVPVVTTVHFIDPRHTQSRTAPVKRPLYRLMLRRTNGIIAVSNAVRCAALAARGPNGPPVRLVHSGIGGGSTTAVSGREARSAEVFYAGRLTAEKQVDVLIEAMARVDSSATLRIAGRGAEDATLRRLARQRLPGRYEFLGFVTNVDALMRRARVFAVPSRAEPFGLVALEAMRAGTPVVGFAAGALPEIVEDGVTGILVAPGDTAALAKALTRVLEDDPLATRLGQAARRRFDERFTAARMAAETEALYAEVQRQPATYTAIDVP